MTKRITLTEFRWAWAFLDHEVDNFIKWQKDNFPYIKPKMHEKGNDLDDIEKIEWFLGQLLEYKRLSYVYEGDENPINLIQRFRLTTFLDGMFDSIKRDLIDSGDSYEC